MISIGTNANSFGSAGVFVTGGGVPSITKDPNGTLVSVFQWFPQNDQTNFDKIGVKISRDNGVTWTEPQGIKINGYPNNYNRPFDPTIILTPEGKLRLYFTCNPKGNQNFDGNTVISSAYSTDGINYTCEPGTRFSAQGRAVYDSAVIYFNNKYHLYCPAGAPQEGARHAISDDGLNFTAKDTIPSSGDNWTGNLMAYENGIRFYGGSGGKGIWWSFSTDGYIWSTPSYTSVNGGDPAVLKVSDDKYILIYVSDKVR
jgi:hypothetical protein